MVATTVGVPTYPIPMSSSTTARYTHLIYRLSSSSSSPPVRSLRLCASSLCTYAHYARWCISKYVKHVRAGRCAVVLDARRQMDRRVFLWRHQICRQGESRVDAIEARDVSIFSSLPFLAAYVSHVIDSKTHPRFPESRQMITVPLSCAPLDVIALATFLVWFSNIQTRNYGCLILFNLLEKHIVFEGQIKNSDCFYIERTYKTNISEIFFPFFITTK